MERTYKLDARLANICCDKLKYIAYYEVAEVLNEFARQDAEFDAQQLMKETQSTSPGVLPHQKKRQMPGGTKGSK